MWQRGVFKDPNRSPPRPRPEPHRLFAVYCGAVSPAAAARTLFKTKGTP